MFVRSYIYTKAKVLPATGLSYASVESAQAYLWILETDLKTDRVSYCGTSCSAPVTCRSLS
jgi:hypothetical protein